MINLKIIKAIRKLASIAIPFFSRPLTANNFVSFICFYIIFGINNKSPAINRAFFATSKYTYDTNGWFKKILLKALSLFSTNLIIAYFYNLSLYSGNRKFYYFIYGFLGIPDNLDNQIAKMNLLYFENGTTNATFISALNNIVATLKNKISDKPTNTFQKATDIIKILYISDLYSQNKIELLEYIKYHDQNKFKIFLYSRYKIPEIKVFFADSNITIIENEKELLNHHFDVVLDCNGLIASDITLFKLPRRLGKIQISAFNDILYYNNPNIDYVLTYQHLFEKIQQDKDKYIPLPDNCVMSVLLKTPPKLLSNTLPCEINNHATFGVVDPMHKISDESLGLWAEILNRLKNSKIIFIHAEYSFEFYRNIIISKLVKLGILPDRLSFRFNYNSYLDELKDIDLLLLSYPIPGGRTLLETLATGFFSIALEKDFVYSRLASLQLQAFGYPELIATSKEEYINKNIELANDPTQIKYYRTTIRKLVEKKFENHHRLMADNLEKELLKRLR